MDYKVVDSAEYGETKDPDFEAWFSGPGYKMFGPDKARARQWYEQRKRAMKRPQVASVLDLMRMTMGA